MSAIISIICIVVISVVCGSVVGSISYILIKNPINNIVGSKGGYYVHQNKDVGTGNIKCFDDGSGSGVCEEKCTNDETCKGFNYVHKGGPWGEKSGCCYKNVNSPLIDSNGVDFYEKTEKDMNKYRK